MELPIFAVVFGYTFDRDKILKLNQLFVCNNLLFEMCLICSESLSW